MATGSKSEDVSHKEIYKMALHRFKYTAATDCIFQDLTRFFMFLCCRQFVSAACHKYCRTCAIFKAFLKGCPPARRGESNLHSLLTKCPFVTMEGDLLHTPHYDSLSLRLLRVDLLNTSHVSGLIHADKMPQSVLFLLYFGNWLVLYRLYFFIIMV